MHLSFCAIGQSQKPLVHGLCHQHSCRELRAASLGAKAGCRDGLCMTLCALLTGTVNSLSLVLASDTPRDMSWMLLAFVLGLHFPSLYATNHFLMFSPLLKNPALSTAFFPLQPPAGVRLCLLREENQRIRRDTWHYKASL